MTLRNKTFCRQINLSIIYVVIFVTLSMSSCMSPIFITNYRKIKIKRGLGTTPFLTIVKKNYIGGFLISYNLFCVSRTWNEKK